MKTASTSPSAAAAPSLPTNDAEAIDFALRHVEGWEVATFLADWRERRNMAAWLPQADAEA
ncbi:hypothetical protein [Ancylobacter sp. IITR112]|uniref:hypothetical protein n=1 Tax=Ancylobacter sp. IITR112 TaxID=3138073 RepID=UPI00352A0C1F